jgi:uncharacterized protein
VHVSQLADLFVRNPSEIVKVRQQVWVTVLEVDLDRQRISLSMKTQGEDSRGRLKGNDSRVTTLPGPGYGITGYVII